MSDRDRERRQLGKEGEQREMRMWEEEERVSVIVCLESKESFVTYRRGADQICRRASVPGGGNGSVERARVDGKVTGFGMVTSQAGCYERSFTGC